MTTAQNRRSGLLPSRDTHPSLDSVSRIVRNPPRCHHCPEQPLVVCSQSLAVSDQGLGSLINAGCGCCGTLFEVNLAGQIVGEQG